MTDQQNPAGPVLGYRPQSEEAVRLVNEFKQDEERLLRKVEFMMDMPKYDPRMLAIARTELQTAFMWLNRAVFQPGRVRLPEDPE